MKGRESGMPEGSTWESFFNPSCIVDRLDCANTQGDVVEFGCGYGTFTIPVARMVCGLVYALDIEPEMIVETKKNAEEEKLDNVIAEERDFVSTGCGRPDGSVGYAMLFNILHIENPVALLGEVHRVLAPGGKVGIINWRNDIETPRGPSMSIRPSAEQCREWGESVELEFERYESLCCCSWHWGLVMRKP